MVDQRNILFPYLRTLACWNFSATEAISQVSLWLLQCGPWGLLARCTDCVSIRAYTMTMFILLFLN